MLRKGLVIGWGLLIVLIPLLGLHPGVTTAQGTAQLSLGAVDVGVAETAVLEARLDCPGGGCSSFRVTLTFDRAAIRINRAAVGPMLGVGAFEAENTVDNAAGSVVLVASAPTPPAGADNVLFTLDVYGLIPGSAQITVGEVQVVGANNIPLSASGTGTTVTIHETGKIPFFSPPNNDWEVAFVSQRDGNPEIYAVDAAGFTTRRLTNDPALDGGPTWSPDGGQLAFHTGRDGNLEIYTMDPNGTNLRRLTDNPAADSDPAWSPDGSQIAFVSDRDGNSEIYVMFADGSSVRRLTNDPAVDTYPAWSPDGSQIAFASSRGGSSEIYVMDVNGGNVQPMTSLFGANGWYPAWAPSGQLLAFSVERDGLADLYTVTQQGQNPRRMTAKSDWLTSSDWSPDGAYIAYMGAPDGNADLLVMDADAQHVFRLTDNLADDTDPDWRPIFQAVPCAVHTPTQNAEIRVGPGFNRGVFTYMPTNQDFTVIGQTTDGDGNLWYELDKTELPGGNEVISMWVLASQVQASGACGAVPSATPPPLIPGTPIPQTTPGWGPCGSCETCGHPGECVTSPAGECLWDPATCGVPQDGGGCPKLITQIVNPPAGAFAQISVREQPNCPDGGYLPGTQVRITINLQGATWSGSCPGASGTNTFITVTMNFTCTAIATFP